MEEIAIGADDTQPEGDGRRRYAISAVDRTVRILDAVAAGGIAGRPLVEIARSAGLSESTALRLPVEPRLPRPRGARSGQRALRPGPAPVPPRPAGGRGARRPHSGAAAHGAAAGALRGDGQLRHPARAPADRHRRAGEHPLDPARRDARRAGLLARLCARQGNAGRAARGRGARGAARGTASTASRRAPSRTSTCWSTGSMPCASAATPSTTRSTRTACAASGPRCSTGADGRRTG